MRVLVWQWGRFGMAPRFAASLAQAMNTMPDVQSLLSLSRTAELLESRARPHCDLPIATYAGFGGFTLRLATAPFAVRGLSRKIAVLRPEVAICALPGPLDLLMAAALRRQRVPYVVLVHDAEVHPGDGFPFLMHLQRMLCRRAAAVGALTTYVAEKLEGQGLAGSPDRPLWLLHLPPVAFDAPLLPPLPHTGTHLLFFGRLLPYKGLDLLLESLVRLGPRPGLRVRIVGSGPESQVLDGLRELPCVSVENHWVPEDEIGTLLAWCDAVVLPYREASQSGVAAAAIAAGRHVLATRVGGLAEQLADRPGVILCEPHADSVLAGLNRLLEKPRPIEMSSVDPRQSWRDLAASLLRHMTTLRRH